jgi:hypothetical protein
MSKRLCQWKKQVIDMSHSKNLSRKIRNSGRKGTKRTRMTIIIAKDSIIRKIITSTLNTIGIITIRNLKAKIIMLLRISISINKTIISRTIFTRGKEKPMRQLMINIKGEEAQTKASGSCNIITETTKAITVTTHNMGDSRSITIRQKVSIKRGITTSMAIELWENSITDTKTMRTESMRRIQAIMNNTCPPRKISPNSSKRVAALYL